MYVRHYCTKSARAYTQIFMNTDLKKISTDCVCPREHFKDKPVDVSCSVTGKTWSRAEDPKKRKRE